MILPVGRKDAILVETIDTLVVGAGQAGIAASAHLSRLDIAHLVVEKDRVAESWRTRRWDSLVANGPAWHDCFPEMQFPQSGPEDFPPKEEVAQALAQFARAHAAPIRTGVEVTRAPKRAVFPWRTLDVSTRGVKLRVEAKPDVAARRMARRQANAIDDIQPTRCGGDRRIDDMITSLVTPRSSFFFALPVAGIFFSSSSFVLFFLTGVLSRLS